MQETGPAVHSPHSRKVERLTICRCNRPRSICQYSSMAPRLLGQNCKFFKFPLSLNSQKRLRYKEHNTRYSSLTWKLRSHVRILIYRTWPIIKAAHSPQLFLDSEYWSGLVVHRIEAPTVTLTRAQTRTARFKNQRANRWTISDYLSGKLFVLRRKVSDIDWK